MWGKGDLTLPPCVCLFLINIVQCFIFDLHFFCHDGCNHFSDPGPIFWSWFIMWDPNNILSELLISLQRRKFVNIQVETIISVVFQNEIFYLNREKCEISLKQRDILCRVRIYFLRSSSSLNPSGFTPTAAHNENFLNIQLKGSANFSNRSHQGKQLYFAHWERCQR